MAVRFDASGDYLRRDGAGDLTGVQDFSFCGWCKRKVDTGAFATVAYISDTSFWEAWAGETETGGDVLHSYELPVESDLTGPTLTIDTWFFFLYKRTDTSRSLYYGTESGGTLTRVDNSDTRVFVTDADRLWLGNDIYTEPFNGEIAWARLWNVALSDAEADAEWSSTTPVKTANLQGDWRLTDAATAGDDSGANNWDLTVGGTLANGGTNPVPPATGGGVIQPAMIRQQGTPTMPGFSDRTRSWN